MQVMMTKSFEYRDEATGLKRVVPRGWSGDLPEGVVGAAVNGGYGTSDELAARDAKATSIQAQRDAVKAAEGVLKAAKTDADKARAEGDLKAAREALAKLEG